MEPNMPFTVRFLKHLFVPLLVLTVTLMTGAPVVAQQTSGSISGVVKDPQGAVVPGANVVITNQEQGAKVRELTTSAEGTFTATPLMPTDAERNGDFSATQLNGKPVIIKDPLTGQLARIAEPDDRLWHAVLHHPALFR
jgi:hypothetical protein